ncbi:MAG: ECF-type sigma factor [Blastocatellia bacterium]
MAAKSATDLTALLNRIGEGDRNALEELITVVLPEVRKIASARLRAERAGHTLQTTDIVNEVFLRIFGERASVSWQNRAHFFAVVARQCRFILIEHARKKKKGGHVSISLEGAGGVKAFKIAVWTDETLVALDEALDKLAAIDARAAQAVELRFFGGLTLREIAEVQKIDVTTVKRDWTIAKSWLYKRLKPST